MGSGQRGRVLEAIGEPLGEHDRPIGPPRRDGSCDPSELALDGPAEPSGRSTHERIQPGDRVIQLLHPIRPAGVARGPVLVEADDLTHTATVPRGSDTLQDPSAV